MDETLIELTAENLNIKSSQVKATLELLEEGSTIPFIARYRKEVTGNLDEEQIREIETIYTYQLKLKTRKEEVKRLIKEKDKLTPEIETAIDACKILSEVEDIYLPYKEKKKTRATTAISYGLEPLADFLLECKNKDVEAEASKYLNENVETVEAALNGAKDIIAERVSEEKDFRQALRDNLDKYGFIVSSIKKNAVDEKQLYALYYDKREMIKYAPSHRILAMNRGENEGILKIKLEHDIEKFLSYNIYKKVIKNINATEAQYLKEAIDDGYSRLLFPSIERETRSNLTEKAGEQAINVFQLNLEQLLLTPPLKNRVILGFDPAYRTGCKLAVIGVNGDFVYKDVIYPHKKNENEVVSEERIIASETKIVNLVKKFNVELIAIGNGTASRESQEFIANVIKKYNLDCAYVTVSEAGASVYSASKLAIDEFPDLHVEERSAISIARRVLDPLSELIKIDPKSIGVGQYQHDVNQSKLSEALDFTISKVVNNVGVNVNTASLELLSYVSGLNKKSAKNLIDYRSKQGLIKNREEIAKIKGIGEKTYTQAIGFLKIYESNNPLDKTFIHPESYGEVEKILTSLNLDAKDIGSDKFNEVLTSKTLSNVSSLGEYTLNDIVEELTKPLRDIRDDYPTPVLKSDVLHIEDLKVGMELEGSVRSVVDFGAFVDIGLHDDGLVHKSKMSRNKVNHPLDIVSVGDIVKVYVIDVDLKKNRVGLSLFKD